MLINRFLTATLVAFGSISAFAASYDCQVSKYIVEDKPMGKGANVECGRAVLSDEAGKENSSYFDKCDGVALSIDNLGAAGLYNIELEKLKPGSADDWMNRTPLRYSAITVESGAAAPKKFSLKFGDRLEHTFTADDEIEYSATCVAQ